MIKAFKAIIVSTSLALTLAASSLNGTAPDNEQLQPDNLYACPWWPACKDPEKQGPVPTERSAPKPTGDKDTSQDKKNGAQLA